MSIRAKRIKSFLNWCAHYVEDFDKPVSRSQLSRKFVKETKANVTPYYFRYNLSNKTLAECIKSSRHALGIQAKLMCLFSLPVDPDFYRALNQFANVELDEYRRISLYEYGKTLIECKHIKPKSVPGKSFKKIVTERIRKETKEETEEEESEYEEDEEIAEVVDYSTLKPNQKEDVEKSTHFSRDVVFTPDPSGPSYPNHSQPTTSRNSGFDDFNGKPSMWQNPDDYYPQFNEDPIPDRGVPEPSTSTSMGLGASYSYESTYIPPLETLLHKLEYFFLYKCRRELMPLCFRIKEIKENEARFSQKIIQESTIKSFFDVFLRLMVANLSKDFIVKVEGDIHEVPPLLFDFLYDLKDQQLGNSIDDVIDNLIIESDNQQTINYYTIAGTFMEIVNSLAQIC